MMPRFTGKIALAVMAGFAIVQQGYCQETDSTEIRRVNPTGALLRSAFVPGWGQLYNRKYIKAAVFAVGESWLANGIYHDWKEVDRHERNFKGAADDPVYQAREFAEFENARDRRNLKMWILAVAIFYSMFDAYVDAQLSDFEQKDKAFEVYVGPGAGDDFRITVAVKFQ